jgi:hypothetical protein
LEDIKNVQLYGFCSRKSGHDSSNKPIKLFDPQFFSARTVGLQSIMLNIGPFVPTVGFAGGIAIVLRTACMRVMIGRVFEELSSAECGPGSGSMSTESMSNETSTKYSSREKQGKGVLSKEEEELQHQGKLLHSLNLENTPLSLLWENHRFMIYLSACWYAWVITDMYAVDKSGEFIAYVPGLVILCFPLLLECVGYVFINWYLPTQIAAKNSINDDDQSTVQAAATRDTSTGSISMAIDVKNPMYSADNDVIPPSSDTDGGSTKANDIYEL